MMETKKKSYRIYRNMEKYTHFGQKMSSIKEGSENKESLAKEKKGNNATYSQRILLRICRAKDERNGCKNTHKNNFIKIQLKMKNTSLRYMVRKRYHRIINSDTKYFESIQIKIKQSENHACVTRFCTASARKPIFKSFKCMRPN